MCLRKHLPLNNKRNSKNKKHIVGKKIMEIHELNKWTKNLSVCVIRKVQYGEENQTNGRQ